ncbi:hypothetical protein Pyn_29789 [Prunus yedoensis var. nudiflora]|uniref:Transmembrane protein n=1 Tax=Prunus yedoensis var. nudiflora TaxID=2094558 RepID=A0A314XKY4_PRUYE|nr:hypothetical protein Pyn_29789 [Prunus yedoensis var. nudiflora]
MPPNSNRRGDASESSSIVANSDTQRKQNHEPDAVCWLKCEILNLFAGLKIFLLLCGFFLIEFFGVSKDLGCSNGGLWRKVCQSSGFDGSSSISSTGSASILDGFDEFGCFPKIPS